MAKCNEDCFNCKLPISKCKGGSNHKAYEHELKQKHKAIGPMRQLIFSHRKSIWIENNE